MVKFNSTQQRQKRKRLFEKHKDCCYCGRLLQWSTCTLQHIMSYSISKNNKYENLEISCERCNIEYCNAYTRWLVCKNHIKEGKEKEFFRNVARLHNTLHILIKNQRRVRSPLFDLWPFVRLMHEYYLDMNYNERGEK